MRLFIGIFLLTLAAVAGWFALYHPPQPAKEAVSSPDYGRYPYSRSDTDRIIDFGMQPNDLSPASISECLFHDRILQKQLSAEGWSLREHRYNNGSDMIPFLDGRLDMAFFGNQPSVTAMVQRNVGIFAVCAIGHNTIITTRIYTPAEFQGLRIGYPFKTNAHFALERALIAAGLSMDDVVSVPMQPGELESALGNRTVDAVICWEPITASILDRVPNSVRTFSSDSYTYVAFDLDFAKNHPEIQKAVLAAIFRASRWLKQNDRNLIDALTWIRKGSIAFSGKSAVEPNARWAALLKTQGIHSPSFPLLPYDITNVQGLFHQQFLFLKKIGIIPANADWMVICDRINTTLLPEVIAGGERWQINLFDYTPDRLVQSDEGS